MAGKLGRVRPFFTIGEDERRNVRRALKKPLSGYLGGIDMPGPWVQRLEQMWAFEFGVGDAIACNSATSGLLAACMAVGIRAGDVVWTTPYSMSATAACAKVLGAEVRFIDIESETFAIDAFELKLGAEKPKAIIIADIFGAGARDLNMINDYCRKMGIWLIEDASQAPFCKHHGQFAGTIGHIGVYSLNVHKHMQCGEGGVIVTSDPLLARNLRGAINHGELSDRAPGLNLRMTEPIAAIACAQLKKGPQLVARKVDLGLTLSEGLEGQRTIRPPSVRHGHVFYVWAALCVYPNMAKRFAEELALMGLPARQGYAPLLTRVFNSGDKVPIAADIDDRIVIVDCCQISPSVVQMLKLPRLIKEAVERAQ